MKDVEKKEPLGIVGGNANWHNHYGKQYGVSSKKNKVSTTIYMIKNSLHNYLSKGNHYLEEIIYTPMFTEALFMIVKTWKQLVHHWLNR